MNRLPVAPGRGVAGNFDQPGQDVLGNGCFLIIPNGPAEAQKLLDVSGLNWQSSPIVGEQSSGFMSIKSGPL